MIIVTGLRSGTSLMMQTLKHLGVPIQGFMYHDDFPHKELNPRGYYDLPINETLNGIHHSDYRGCALKLYGAQLNRTNPEFINCVLHLTRNREDTIKSINKLIVANLNLLEKRTGKIPSAEEAYEINSNLIEKFLEDNNTIPFLQIKYEHFLDDPQDIIDWVCEFLNIKNDTKKAVKNVNREAVWQ